MTKKITALITALAMMTTGISVYAAKNTDAEEYEIKGEFEYVKGTNDIVNYLGTSEVIEIPANCKIKSYAGRFGESANSVTKLIMNEGAGGNINRIFPSLKDVEYKEGVTTIDMFSSIRDNRTVENIIFPSTLKTIDRYSFQNCRELKSVELPEGLERIERECFTKLPSLSGDISIPSTVTYMGYGCFAECGDLNKVHLPDNITYSKEDGFGYGDNANWFLKTHIMEINIPSSILRDKNAGFNAEEITFNGDMTMDIYNLLKNSDWCKNKYLKKKTDKSSGNDENYIIIEDTLIKYIGRDKNPVVPEGVTAIAGRAFDYVDIDTVTLPKSLEVIKEDAFHHTTLKEITIPENIRIIESHAFSDCPIIKKAIFEKLPDEKTWYIFSDSIYLSDDYKDNIIYTKGETPDYLYSGCMGYNLRDFYESLNYNGGYNLTSDNDYITTPSNDAAMLAAGNIPESAMTPAPKSTTVPKGTAMPTAEPIPEETVQPAAADMPKTTPKPLTLSVHTGNEITVNVSGKAVTFPDAQPFIDNHDRTQIPIRAVADMLNCKVDWNDETKTVTITSGNGRLVILTIDSSIMKVNNNAIQMDTSAVIKNERTYIPVRFVAEAMGLMVEWSDSLPAL